MYVELYEYLLLHNNVSVPGLGTFLLERRPAQMDFANKLVHAPVYSLTYKESVEDTTALCSWLASYWNISFESASERFETFTGKIKRLQSLVWDGVGVITRRPAGIVFTPERPIQAKPVPAHKVIREKSTHMVRVGEDQRSSAEMESMLQTADTVRKSNWWVWAMVIGIPAIIFIGWYFSEHGIDTSTTSNTGRAAIQETINY
jgi:hypothetical protein